MATINFNYTYGLLIIIVLFFILWLFFGGENYEFVGVQPLYNIDPYVEGALSAIPKDNNQNNKNNNKQNNQIQNERKDSTLSSELNSVCGSVNYERELSSTQLKQVRDLKSERIKLLSLNKENLEKIAKLEAEKYANANNNRNGAFMSKAESECKRVLNEIYGIDFKKVRPNWLKNPETGANLELDLYNENVLVRGVSYRVALETNGIQHNVYPNGFHRSEDEFRKQLRRDMYKADVCEREGVYLITVPYTVKLKDIKDYIVKSLPECLNPML